MIMVLQLQHKFTILILHCTNNRIFNNSNVRTNTFHFSIPTKSTASKHFSPNPWDVYVNLISSLTKHKQHGRSSAHAQIPPNHRGGNYDLT